MNELVLRLGSHRFSKKISPFLTKQIIDDKELLPSDNCSNILHGRVSAALVNLDAVCYDTLAQFVDEMNNCVEQAVAKGAQLVCFPQYTGLLPLTVFSQYDILEEEAENALLACDEATLGMLGKLYSKYLSDIVFDCYYNTFALLAMKHKIYIQAGTILVNTSRGLVNRGFLFDPNGESILQQDKLFPNRGEKMLGVCSGSDLKTAETPFGPISIIIGEDSLYFEVYRLAASRGCKFVIAPSGGEDFPSEAHYAKGALMRAQECNLFVIQPTMFYNLFPTQGKGAGAVYCPYRISENSDGIVTASSSQSVLVKELNSADLVRLVDDYWGDKNALVYRLLAQDYENAFGHSTTLPPQQEQEASIAFLAESDSETTA
ncbi:MAG: hypothetical protein IKV41_02625 [Oscillospiraceae bacterium]|nr:hypothetical protein [Oscillospiraceae bacterium]